MMTALSTTTLQELLDAIRNTHFLEIALTRRLISKQPSLRKRKAAWRFDAAIRSSFTGSQRLMQMATKLARHWSRAANEQPIFCQVQVDDFATVEC